MFRATTELIRPLLVVSVLMVTAVGCNPRRSQKMDPNQVVGALNNEQQSLLAQTYAPLVLTDMLLHGLFNPHQTYVIPNARSPYVSTAIKTLKDESGAKQDARCRIEVESGNQNVGLEYAGGKRIYSRSGESSTSKPEEVCPVDYSMESPLVSTPQGISSVLTLSFESRGVFARSDRFVKKMDLSGTGQQVMRSDVGGQIQVSEENYSGTAILPKLGQVNLFRKIRRQIVYQGNMAGVREWTSHWEVVNGIVKVKVEVVNRQGIGGVLETLIYVNGTRIDNILFTQMIEFWDRGVDTGAKN